MVNCKLCGKETKNKKYCSKSCAGIARKDEFLKVAKKAHKRDKSGDKNPRWLGEELNSLCPQCGILYRKKRKTQTYCSKQCWQNKMSKFMQEGHAAYMNKFITNPSKPQLELYELVKRNFNCELNYLEVPYNIDIVIPEHNIAIEYDGSYWHDEEKDKIRQMNLEKCGWVFLRYLDYVPSEEELLKDIGELINEPKS